MIEMPILIRALFAGLLIGMLFYGGLWWTIRRALSNSYVGVWVLGSFLLRTCIALAGFYVVARNDWRALLACLLGFLVARIGITRLTRVSPERKCRALQGLEL
jgi:F1F0 ATPase subunit 2